MGSQYREDLHWRDKRVCDRLGFALESDKRYKDVHFIVGKNEVKISAHKLIVRLSSLVLEKLITSHEEKGLDEISLPNTPPNMFRRLLKFIYTDELEMYDMLDFLKVARDFGFKALSEQSILVLKQTEITIDNAVFIFEIAKGLGEYGLVQSSLSFILNNAKEVLSSDAFLSLSHVSLCQILLDDKLATDELTVFQAVIKWGRHQLTMSRVPITPETMRGVLKDAKHCVRYTHMSYDQVLSEVKPAGILLSEELIQVLKYYVDPSTNLNNHSKSRTVRAEELQTHKLQAEEVTKTNLHCPTQKVSTFFKDSINIPKQSVPLLIEKSAAVNNLLNQNLNVVPHEEETTFSANNLIIKSVLTEGVSTNIPNSIVNLSSRNEKPCKITINPELEAVTEENTDKQSKSSKNYRRKQQLKDKNAFNKLHRIPITYKRSRGLKHKIRGQIRKLVASQGSKKVRCQVQNRLTSLLIPTTNISQKLEVSKALNTINLRKSKLNVFKQNEEPALLNTSDNIDEPKQLVLIEEAAANVNLLKNLNLQEEEPTFLNNSNNMDLPQKSVPIEESAATMNLLEDLNHLEEEESTFLNNSDNIEVSQKSVSIEEAKSIVNIPINLNLLTETEEEQSTFLNISDNLDLSQKSVPIKAPTIFNKLNPAPPNEESIKVNNPLQGEPSEIITNSKSTPTTQTKMTHMTIDKGPPHLESKPYSKNQKRNLKQKLKNEYNKLHGIEKRYKRNYGLAWRLRGAQRQAQGLAVGPNTLNAINNTHYTTSIVNLTKNLNPITQEEEPTFSNNSSHINLSQKSVSMREATATINLPKLPLEEEHTFLNNSDIDLTQKSLPIETAVAATMNLPKDLNYLPLEEEPTILNNSDIHLTQKSVQIEEAETIVNLPINLNLLTQEDEPTFFDSSVNFNMTQKSVPIEAPTTDIVSPALPNEESNSKVDLPSQPQIEVMSPELKDVSTDEKSTNLQSTSERNYQKRQRRKEKIALLKSQGIEVKKKKSKGIKRKIRGAIRKYRFAQASEIYRKHYS